MFIHLLMWVCQHSHSVLSDSLHPMDCSLPGFSVHGIFQARILEWVDIFTSGESLWLRDQTCTSSASCIGKWVLYLLSHQGSLYVSVLTVNKNIYKCTYTYTGSTFTFEHLTRCISTPFTYSSVYPSEVMLTIPYILLW